MVKELMNKVIEENSQLKNIIIFYESNLSQLDSILRRDDEKDECIFQLKKLNENQLHSIVKM